MDCKFSSQHYTSSSNESRDSDRCVRRPWIYLHIRVYCDCHSLWVHPIEHEKDSWLHPFGIIEVSLDSPAESSPTFRFIIYRGKAPQSENVFAQKCLAHPDSVDYGLPDCREFRGEEAGRLLLHRQHLSGEMRISMPESAHHPHICLFQALSGTSFANAWFYYNPPNALI